VIVTPSTAIVVGLGDLQVSYEHELVAYSLGSCVGICLWDPSTGIAAMAHVVLPTAPDGPVTQPGKYGDTAVPALLEALGRRGARLHRLHCRVVGGATVLALGGGSSLPNIGARNVESVKAALARARVRLLAEETGGDRGRTVRLEPRSGRVVVRTARGREVEL
jgi:chemotaxis protein CheD